MKSVILLDFDDTILNTTKYKISQDKFWQAELSVKTGAKITEYLRAFRRGEFDIFRPHSQMSASEWELAKVHIREYIPKLLFADALKFIEKVDKNKFTPMILTFGDREFQEAKIRASGLEIPTIFTENKNKSVEISKFWKGNFFEISGENFAEIVLIDDRDYSFAGFEKLKNARGFLLNRAENSRKIDEKSLAKNVKIVKSFAEIEV